MSETPEPPQPHVGHVEDDPFVVIGKQEDKTFVQEQNEVEVLRSRLAYAEHELKYTKTEARWLRNRLDLLRDSLYLLLAQIHQDEGQHTQRVGYRQSVQEAMQRLHNLNYSRST